jgi:hypothetical protein
MEFGRRARSTPLGTVLDRLDQWRTVADAASVPAETEEGKASVQRLNEDLTGRIGRLKSILRRGLDREVSGTSRARSQDSSAQNLATNNRLAAARDDFECAKADYDRAEAARQEWVHEQTSRYEAALPAHDNEVARHNSRIAQIASGLRNRDRESVQWYLELALSRTLLPEEVPHMVELAYSPQGEQAVVRLSCPQLRSSRRWTLTHTCRPLRRCARRNVLRPR